MLKSATLVALLSVVVTAGQETAPVSSSDVDGLLRAGKFDQAERLARTRIEQLRASGRAGTLPGAAATDLLVRALVLNGRAASAETLALAEEALRTKEAALGDGDPDLVPSLLNLADGLVGAGEFDRAIGVAERAVTLRERATATARPTVDLALALDHLGAALSARRRHDDALAVFGRSLTIKAQVLDPFDAEIARTLESMALVLQRKAAYTQSGTLLRRAASIQEAFDANHPAYATTLNLLAQQLWFEGDLLASRDASERAVAHAERALRPDHPTLALSLRYLAATVCDLGDSARCLALTRRALEIAERAFGARHYVTAEYLNDLGFVQLDQGDYQSARRLLEQALAIYRQRYGEWHEYVATTLSGLARADARLGDYARAGRELSRVSAIFTRVGGRNHPFVAIALTQLATVYLEEGMPSQALPLLERALAIREKALGGDHRDVAGTLVDLAATLMQMNRPTGAQRLARRAIQIWEQLDAPDAPEYARVLALYARLQLNRGDVAAARDYYERALAIRTRVFGQSHPLYAEAQAGLALTLAAAGDRSTALRTAFSAEITGREHLSLMLRSLPERQALNYAAARPRGLDLVLSLASSVPDGPSKALDGLIRSRALVLDEIAARQSAKLEGHDDIDPRAALTSAQQRLANLIVRGPGQMSATQYQAVIEATRRESERAEQALAEASAEFRAARNRTQIGLKDVTAALPVDGALVSFARYQRTVFGGVPASRTLPSYAALILRRDRPVAVVPLGSAESIDRLVGQWRAAIAREGVGPANAAPGEAVPTSRASGALLRRRIWDPLLPHLTDAKRVFIVPEGAVGLVPFAALPVGQRSYLVESGPVLHYLSAERDLVPRSEKRAGHGLLALGGPSFDDSSLFGARAARFHGETVSKVQRTRRGSAQLCGSLLNASFASLDGTLQEVRDLSGIWNANPATQAESARVLVGHDASETRFKREAPGARILHLATHGFFVNGACSNAPGGARGIGGISKRSGSPTVENPLRLSGLALAGANRRALAGPDEDEGILTAEEVASLNLEGVEWAVLSACDTGVGEIKAGEGVFGLRRAFQVAGAHTVIMSLWSVDDRATRAWMRALYEARFQENLSTADAVHAANVAVLRARRAAGRSTNPFYWSAFIAVGDWR